MKRIIAISLLVSILLGSGCTPGTDFDARLQPLAAPYRFSIAGWVFNALSEQAGQWLAASLPSGPFGARAAQAKVQDETGEVVGYFTDVERIRTIQSAIDSGSTATAQAQLEAELRALQAKQQASAASVENTIKKQIREALAEAGIYNPVTNHKVNFPPLNFSLEETPNLLVISPRDKIEPLKEIVLQQDLTLEQREALEASVEKMGVSSLVVKVGGMATYPSLVDSQGGLAWTLETVAHEWVHQYLAFTPLGFRYVLNEAGISRNYALATMNESVANIVGKEIGEKVYRKYYSSGLALSLSNGKDGANKAAAESSHFNSEMREIRKAVDAYLARGEVNEAEAFMEQKRQELAAEGYHIRKLNQAYFAFHGTYADGPAFLNPIGLELKQLRSQSGSLKSFLSNVSRFTARQDLADSVR